MDNTAKVQKKSSLSLTTRLSKKRHSSSPQNIAKTAASNSVAANNRESSTTTEVPRSPSVISICSDGGIECCTPPQKRNGMFTDDCGDYSPKVFDSSFSPSCLLSQTLAIDSPEVGWKWSRYSAGSKEEIATRTPDSAYAADSSFTSAGSSSTELINARARTETYNQRMAYDALREQHLRKVEKTRADQKLKLRCAKLQEQLKGAGTQKSSPSPNNGFDKSEATTSSCTLTATDADMATSQSTTSTVKMVSPMDTMEKVTPKLNDFFNDSDEDCFLLAATQEIETQMNAQNQTQPTQNPCKAKTTTSLLSSNDKSKSKTATHSSSSNTFLPSSSSPATCADSPKQEKRSSFYMKFLEDDCPDDWFISLDDIIEQATQSKKPRTSFQRYKSMPANSNDVANNNQNTSKTKTTTSDTTLNESLFNDSLLVEAMEAATSSSTTPSSSSTSTTLRSKIKRHSSSHVLSPSNANCK
uniref:Uncharacterized protein n=1 Tax=Stomoxys calcitrans TaxID=35570 RepID=A0A1I8PMK9_STOCA